MRAVWLAIHYSRVYKYFMTRSCSCPYFRYNIKVGFSACLIKIFEKYNQIPGFMTVNASYKKSGLSLLFTTLIIIINYEVPIPYNL